MSVIATSAAAPARGTGVPAAEAMLQYLRDRGVEQVFGVVGREASSILFNEVEGIDFVLTRHEFTAGIMADVLARVTGQPQVCFSTLGPGVTNLTTAVASACLDRSPVIVLGAQAETNDQFVNHTHQCLDNVALMAPMTKFATEVRRPEELLPTLERAFSASMEGLPGPSFVSIPIDVLGACVEPPRSAPRPAAASRSTIVGQGWEEELSAVSEAIRQGDNPLLVVGTATAREGAVDDVRALSEAMQIPIVTSYTAKGVLPPDSPLNHGAISGYMDGILDYPALDELFGPADLLVLVGYDYAEDLRPTMWARGETKRVARIASFPNPTPGILDPDLDVVCPLPEAVRLLRTMLSDAPAKQPAGIEALRERVSELLADTTEDDLGLRAHQVMNSINQVLAGGTLVSDIGFFRHFGVLFGRAEAPYRFITSAGCSTFGFGLPAAMGAKLANPDLPVVLVAGDGGFHSNSQDLETLVRLGLQVVVVVLDNQSNGLIRLYQNLGHGRDHGPAVDFGPVDYVALAEANGCPASRADTLAEFADALEQAVSAEGPYLIEVPIHYDLTAAGGYQALDI